MKIIFGGKFVYFILAALIFFLVFGIIMALEESEFDIGEIYALFYFLPYSWFFILRYSASRVTQTSAPWRLFSGYLITAIKSGWYGMQ